jgi:hypothetical protein
MCKEIQLVISATTTGTTTAAGIFFRISVLAGTVNIGSTTGNTIGSTTGNDAIQVSSTASLGLVRCLMWDGGC